MTPSDDVYTIKSNNPDFTIPGIDTSVGIQVPDSNLRSFQSLTSADGIYYNAALNVVVVFKDGADLSGIDFRGTSVMVQANNVSISNSKFDASSGLFAVKSYAGTANLLIDRCAFDGLKLDKLYSDFVIGEGANTTITNSSFVNAPADAIYIESGTVAGNYIAGGGYQSGAHADAIWVGKTTGQVNITGNLIDWRASPDAAIDTNNAIRITSENGDVSGVTVQDNVVLGGRYGILVTDLPTESDSTVGSIDNVAISHNVVDWGQFGPIKNLGVDTGLTYTGNLHASGPGGVVAYAGNPAFPSANVVTGSALADTLHGSSRADLITGGDGKDWISAGAGNDVIHSGLGRDYLTGGAGADHFLYASLSEMGTGYARDLITDFQAGIDKLYFAGLSDLPASAAGQTWRWLGSEGFAGNPLEVHYRFEGANTIVSLDVDGDMKADAEIELAGNIQLGAGDFLIASTSPLPVVSVGARVFEPISVILGTAGADTLTGTAAAEKLTGLSGDDIIQAGDGNDVINGGLGKDLMTGGAGQDRFVFEAAAESAVGGAYRDYIYDFVHGEDLIDLSQIDAVAATSAHELFAWIGSSSFTGAAGQLRYQQLASYGIVQADLNGDKIADFEFSLAGQHELVSTDFIFKLAPVNVSPLPRLDTLNNITGSATVDYLQGSAGADYMFGGDKNDWMSGGAGNDVLQSGAGRDYLTGGAGNDFFYYASLGEVGIGATRDLVTDFQAGTDRIFLSGAGLDPAKTWTWLGDAAFGGQALDVRYAYTSTNTVVSIDMDGNRTADAEIELSGRLNLQASDFFFATPGAGDQSAAPSTAEVPADTTRFDGTLGNDVLVGGAGGDLLVGGAGSDILTGGGGGDWFVFQAATDSLPSAASRDSITDFTPGSDRIDLSDFDAIPATAGIDGFSWLGTSGFSGAAGQLRYSAGSASTLVQADLNGDKVADFEIYLGGKLDLSSHDFLLT